MTTHLQRGPQCASVKCVSLSIGPLAGQRGLFLAGEADITTRSALHEALSEELAGSEGDVHLELAGLSFIDVGCTREIVTAAAHHPGAHVIIHQPPIALRQIVSLMWPETGIDMR
jgi:anti-anti-sigma regulatory factor